MAAASAPASTSPAACDLRVASADAFFQVAEVDVAITADLGTLQRLGYLIPQGVLRELTYTGRRMGAEEAARYGLVNRIEADRDAALAAGLALARTIAAKSPLAVAGAKKSLNHSRGRPSRRGCATSPCGTPRPWSAPTSARRSRRGSARPSRASARSTIRRRRTLSFAAGNGVMPPPHARIAPNSSTSS